MYDRDRVLARRRGSYFRFEELYSGGRGDVGVGLRVVEDRYRSRVYTKEERETTFKRRKSWRGGDRVGLTSGPVDPGSVDSSKHRRDVPRLKSLYFNL